MVVDCRLSEIVLPFAVDRSEATPFTGGSHEDRLRTYYQSAIACFGTLRRFNPEIVYSFATNVAPPPGIQREFEDLGVQLRLIDAPSVNLLPAGTTFRTSLYLFDVLRASAIAPGTAVAFLDPDVACVRPLRIALRDGGVGYLPLSTAAEDSIKGVTLAELSQVRAAAGLRRPAFPVHVGGEILVVTPGALPGLTERVGEALARIVRGDSPRFGNEEHVLTYAQDEHWTSLRPVIARIWTSERYRDVPDDVLELSLWHLPAEKTRGFGQVYRAAREGWLDRTSDDELRRSLGSWLQVATTPGQGR